MYYNHLSILKNKAPTSGEIKNLINFGKNSPSCLKGVTQYLLTKENLFFKPSAWWPE